MERILKPEQKMYIILLMASGLRDEYAGKEEGKTDYQIASRIYASTFAGMIRHGFPISSEEKDGVAFLDMELEGRTYSCPARTVKNTLKAEFTAVEEKLPEILPLLEAEEERLMSTQRGRKRRGKGKENVQEMPQEKTGDAASRQAKEAAGSPAGDKAAAPRDTSHQADAKPMAAPVSPVPSDPPIDEAKPEGPKMPSTPQGPKTPEIMDIPAVPNAKAEPVKDTFSGKLPQTGQLHDEGEDIHAGKGQESGTEYAEGSGPAPQAPVPGTEAAGQQGHEGHEGGTALLPDPAPGPLPDIPDAPDKAETGEPAHQPADEGKAEASGKADEEIKGAELLSEPEPAKNQPEPETSPSRQEPVPTEVETPARHVFQKKERVMVTPHTDSGTAGGDTAEAVKKTIKEEIPEKPESKVPGAAANTAHPEPERKPMGVFSRFLPKSKKQELKNTAQAVPGPETAGAEPDVIPQIPEEAPGERICHTHYVMLKKTYGTQVAGPYTIQVWPTEVIEMHTDKVPSGIFVRAKAPNGTVVCKTGDSRTKYVVLEIDRKQFNVFGFWENGVFTTRVDVINTTASMYTMSEEVEQECPAQVSDAFLDQFRSRESKRLEFFVVPVENVSHGVPCVPIAAFARVGDNNYVINNKGEGNNLRFSYDGELSEISGHWEDGKFSFTIRPVEQE